MRENRNQNVAISIVWYRRFCETSDCIGTEHESDAVWKFYHSLLNLGEGKLAIKDIVQEYIRNTWRPKVVSFYEDTIGVNRGVPELELTYSRDAENRYIKELFSFIIQTIQDSGVGFPTVNEITKFEYDTED